MDNFDRQENENNPIDKIAKSESAIKDALRRNVVLQQASNATSDMGDITAGRFISPSPDATSAEPTDSGFSGFFQSGAGEEFPDGVMKSGAVTNGVLNFGVAEDGSVIANSVTFNGAEVDARLTLDDFGWMTRQTGTEGSEVRKARFGMESNGTNGETVIEHYEPGAVVTIPNGDFATLDFTGWDATNAGGGIWSASAGYAYHSGNDAGGSIENAARFAVSALSNYNFSVYAKIIALEELDIATLSVYVKFYTAVSGGSLVSTELVGTQSVTTLDGGAWVLHERNITVPATATHALFFAETSSAGLLNWYAYFDDFAVVLTNINTRLSLKDDGLYYLQPSGVEFKVAPNTVTAPLSGNGAAATPIKIINDAAATITEIDTGALATSDTVIPTSKAARTYADTAKDLANATNPTAASAAFNAAAKAAGDFVMIADSGILSASAANVDFTSIPQTYKHLRLIVSLRSDRAATADTILMRFNNDSGANYDYLVIQNTAAATTRTEALAGTATSIGVATGSTAVASDFNTYVVSINDYRNANKNKDAVSVGTHRTSAAANGILTVAVTGHWRSTTAISRITILPNTGTNWVQYSRITLYGYN